VEECLNKDSVLHINGKPSTQWVIMTGEAMGAMGKHMFIEASPPALETNLP
jgi:hypothetical protein